MSTPRGFKSVYFRDKSLLKRVERLAKKMKCSVSSIICRATAAGLRFVTKGTKHELPKS